MSAISLSLSDIDKIVVDYDCEQLGPCQHYAKVVLKDGRESPNLNSFQICSVVSNLAIERINPNENEKWNADAVKQHFHQYSKSNPDLGWFVEPPEVVLNRVFSNK